MQPSIYKKIKPSVIFKKNRRVHEKSYIVRFFQWWYFVIWTVWMWGLYSMLNFSMPCWQKSFTCFVETYFQFVEIMFGFISFRLAFLPDRERWNMLQTCPMPLSRWICPLWRNQEHRNHSLAWLSKQMVWRNNPNFFFRFRYIKSGTRSHFL